MSNTIATRAGPANAQVRQRLTAMLRELQGNRNILDELVESQVEEPHCSVRAVSLYGDRS